MKEPHTARDTSRHAPAGRTVCISVFLTELSFRWGLPTMGGASTSPGLLLSFMGSFLGRSKGPSLGCMVCGCGPGLWSIQAWLTIERDANSSEAGGGLHSRTLLSAAWGQQRAADAWPLSEGMGCPHPDPVAAWMVPGSRAGL